MSGGFFKSTSIVGAFTLLSRVTGLLRDMVYSRMFGAGVLMDAFLVAFKIPNFMRRLFAEGAFSQAFVPVISEYKVRRSPAEVRELVGSVSGTLGAALFILTAVGVIAAPLLVLVFAPGFTQDAGRFDLTVDMLRLTFPYIFFMSLVALSSGILNSYGRFAVPAFTPVLLNAVMIVFASVVAPNFDRPGIALASGVFVAGLVQLLLQLPALRALALLPMPRWGWPHEGVRRIARLMLPGIFGSSVAQISLLLDTLIASFLVTGSIAWMYYADRLVEFPLGVVAMAAATAVLPGMSRDAAAGRRDRVGETFGDATRLVSFITLPATAGLMLLADPIVDLLFRRGEFTAADVRLTALALSYYALGLWSFSLVRVAVAAFFALQDARTPFRAATVCIAANLLMGVALMGPLAHGGMALAASAASTLNLGILLLALERRVGRMRWGAVARSVARSGFNTAVMSGGLWLFAGAMAGRCDSRILTVGTCVAAGVLLYGAASWATGSPELRELVSLGKGRGRAQ